MFVVLSFTFLLIITLGITLGVGVVIGWLNPYILVALTATGLPLATMLLQHIKQARLIAQYSQREQHLIKP